MKLPRLTLRRYPHSATSNYVVTWTTGSKPSRIQVNAWKALNPHASDAEASEFARGTWTRHRRFFRTKEDAKAFLDAQEIKLSNEGRRALALPDEVRVQAAKAHQRLQPMGYTLQQAVDFFLKHLETTRRSVTVSALIPEYKAAKRRIGLSEIYFKDLDHRLGNFERTFGNQLVADITTAMVEDWLAALGLAAQSINNYRAVLRAFFQYAVKRDYLPQNPVARIEKVKVKDKPPEIFTPAELTAVLNAATEDTLPVIAIGAFAGLRMAEILRLEWSEIDLVRGYIEVKAAKAKTARRRLVTILPNLSAWLRPYAGRSGFVWSPRRALKPGKEAKPGGESSWRMCIAPVLKSAGLRQWPQNGLRHSYGSYHLAKFQDAAKLALEMGHTTTKEIFAHYRELVRPEDAARYWAIAPAAEPGVVSLSAG